MKTWVCDSGQKLEIFIPFMGNSRPFSGRCCQTCTPRSWDGFHPQQLSSRGFRDAGRLTEEDTRYRGWLVRRVCGLLAVWGWRVPAETPGDLPARVCRSRRVRDVAARRRRGDGESHRPWKEQALEILAEIQAPLSLLTLRLCNWVLLKLLNRLFHSVQLHRGQLEMVLRAAATPGVPLVFLSTHKSQLDGPLLSFLLFSQGLGVPRVTVGGGVCSPRLRALLGRLGGIFLPARMERKPGDEGLAGAVLAAYVEEVLRSRQPLLIFLEEPPAARCLSAAAREWLATVYRAVRDGTVPDVLLVPVGIAYDVAPGDWPRDRARGAEPLGLGACLWAACRALRRRRGCARVDFAQPFSLQEFAAKNLAGTKAPAQRPLPASLGTRQPDGAEAAARSPGAGAADEALVTTLGLHALSDGVACSAIMAAGMTAALLLHKHPEGVFLSRLMRDFAWLLEETLLRQRDVGFSGRLRALLRHSLALLAPRVTLYRVPPLGDVLVVPEASAEARRELGRHGAAVLPVFASEAVGACAVRALLTEMVPFVGAAISPAAIVLSQAELRRKTLELLQLLPPALLGFQPCQPLDHRSQDVVDKLLLCGLLQAEEPESERWACDLAPRPLGRRRPDAGLDFTDSEEEEEEEEVSKRCFKLSEPQGSPGFLLFLCRLLSPVLRTYARAAAFLERPSWPQREEAYVEALLRFLAEEDGSEHPDRSLALSSLQSFKEMGVLEEVGDPCGPLLRLAQPFRSRAGRAKLEAFIHQFTQC